MGKHVDNGMVKRGVWTVRGGWCGGWGVLVREGCRGRTGLRGGEERSPAADTEDNGLLSCCQPHLSTFTSPPSPRKERVRKRTHQRASCWHYAPICRLNSMKLHEGHTQVNCRLIMTMMNRCYITCAAGIIFSFGACQGWTALNLLLCVAVVRLFLA